MENLTSILEHRRSIYRPTPAQSVVEWAESNIILTRRQTESPGPFSTAVRPYMRDPLECWKDPSVSEVVLCWGSQTAKTTMLMVGLAWKIDTDPAPAIVLMPSENLARSFSKARWRPMLDDCAAMVRHYPVDRHQLTTLEQHFDRCTLNFIGSNSASNLASRPVGVLVADEVDKFAEATAKEADAVELAEQRLKAFNSSKAFFTSTPTVDTGRIWQKFLAGDRRYYLIPCPHCKKLIRLEWGQVKWDQNARGDDGWDYLRVRESAHYECQECHGAITDAHKVAALRHGEWRPTNPKAMPGIRSYHLSSLYSPDRKCTFGYMAVAWLEAQASPLGLQGFVNGYLAEPWMNQGDQGAKIDSIATINIVPGEWMPMMTVDCQAKAPYFWYVVRAWRAGDSHGIESGSAAAWEDLDKIQKRHGIARPGVFLDSGYSRSEFEVYRECARRCDVARSKDSGPMLIGWSPMKGQPGSRRWTTQGKSLPWRRGLVDPFEGTGMKGQVGMWLIEFATDPFKDILEMLRKGELPSKWTVSREMATEAYLKHMDAEFKGIRHESFSGRQKFGWHKRSKRWPDHLRDCEILQVVAANYQELFEIPKELEKEEAR